MERNDPHPTEPEPQTEASGPASESATRDALRRLEERLERASSAAERLMAEAATEAASHATSRGANRPPPAGWQAPGAGSDRPPPAGWQTPGAGSAATDTDLLVQLVHSLRELIPPELQRRLAEALRELLLALRALIDWYLERVERRRQEPTEVQDIPIA